MHMGIRHPLRELLSNYGLTPGQVLGWWSESDRYVHLVRIATAPDTPDRDDADVYDGFVHVIGCWNNQAFMVHVAHLVRGPAITAHMIERKMLGDDCPAFALEEVEGAYEVVGRDDPSLVPVPTARPVPGPATGRS